MQWSTHTVTVLVHFSPDRLVFLITQLCELISFSPRLVLNTVSPPVQVSCGGGIHTLWVPCTARTWGRRQSGTCAEIITVTVTLSSC
jgi:hypothetical protein